MRKPLALALWVFLSACGGGGDRGGAVPPPALDVSPTSVELAATVGDAPGEGEIRVRNAGGGALSFRAGTTAANLALAPAAGSLAAGASAAIRLTYTCEAEGTHNATIEVSGGQRTVAVSVTAVCHPARAPAPDGFAYSDHPPLPDGASVATPWHMTNVRVDLVGVPGDFETFCTTLRIEGETPRDVNLYISPFNGTLNRLTYYGGIQTHIDGLDADGRFVRRDRGAIFSRWRERDTDAISPASGGLYNSLGNEGDFISVRNDFDWGEGRYRLCLVKSGEIAGDPLPDNYSAGDIAYAWNKYVHTRVRMEATDLASGQTTFIGALAVPGTTIALRHHNVLFAEMYGSPNPFPAERVPDITILVEDFSINGRALSYSRVSATSNPIPGRAGNPKMTRIRYDAGEKEIRIELGRFTGRFGVLHTAVEPSRPAVESASLVSIDGDGYILALRDGQTIGTDDLPSARLNVRADPVDAGQVGSMRLALTGPVSMSRLTNDAPFLLSGGTTGLALPLGQYAITVTPFAQPDGQGEQGPVFETQFTVAAASQSGSFRDPRLLAHMEAILGAALTGASLARELMPLESLVVAEGGVSDLGGLEHAINLRVLRLPGNEIEDLTALSGLRRLKVLDLSGNRIRDVAPLRGLAALRRLDLRDNAVADIAPLAGLAALELLDLSGNTVTGPEPLGALAALRRLELARNGVRDLEALAALADLRVLNITDNPVQNLAPLAGLIALRELYANGNGISDLAPLAGLVGLRELALSRNRIVDIRPLAGLHRLTQLEANDNRIARLDPLIGLDALERLELDANRFRQVGLLAGLPHLKVLSIRHNDVRDLAALDAAAERGLRVIGAKATTGEMTRGAPGT